MPFGPGVNVAALMVEVPDGFQAIVIGPVILNTSCFASPTQFPAIPNFNVIRPADGNETAAAWKVALEREDGPVGFALSRQKLPTLASMARDDTGKRSKFF